MAGNLQSSDFHAIRETYGDPAKDPNLVVNALQSGIAVRRVRGTLSFSMEAGSVFATSEFE